MSIGGLFTHIDTLYRPYSLTVYKKGEKGALDVFPPLHAANEDLLRRFSSEAAFPHEAIAVNIALDEFDEVVSQLRFKDSTALETVFTDWRSFLSVEVTTSGFELLSDGTFLIYDWDDMSQLLCELDLLRHRCLDFLEKSSCSSSAADEPLPKLLWNRSPTIKPGHLLESTTRPESPSSSFPSLSPLAHFDQQPLPPLLEGRVPSGGIMTTGYVVELDWGDDMSPASTAPDCEESPASSILFSDSSSPSQPPGTVAPSQVSPPPLTPDNGSESSDDSDYGSEVDFSGTSGADPCVVRDASQTYTTSSLYRSATARRHSPSTGRKRKTSSSSVASTSHYRSSRNARSIKPLPRSTTPMTPPIPSARMLQSRDIPDSISSYGEGRRVPDGEAVDCMSDDNMEEGEDDGDDEYEDHCEDDDEDESDSDAADADYSESQTRPPKRRKLSKPKSTPAPAPTTVKKQKRTRRPSATRGSTKTPRFCRWGCGQFLKRDQQRHENSCTWVPPDALISCLRCGKCGSIMKREDAMIRHIKLQHPSEGRVSSIPSTMLRREFDAWRAADGRVDQGSTQGEVPAKRKRRS